MRRTLIVAVLFLISTGSLAQTHKIDSTRNRIYSSGDEASLKKNLLFALTLQRSMNQDTLGAYIKQLSGLKSLSPGERMYMDIGRSYYFLRKGMADSSMRIVEYHLAQLHRGKPDMALQIIYEFLQAGLMLRKNQHKAAMDGYFNVLKLAEQSHDIDRQIGSLNGIGWVYMEMFQYAEGIKWFNKALAVPILKKHEQHYGTIYSNMASCYGALGKIDSANYCIDRSIAFSVKYEDLIAQANACMVKGNICIVEQKTYEGLASMTKALAIRKILNDPYYILSDLCLLSSTYATLNKTDQGLAYAREALAMARKYNIMAKLPMVFISFENNYQQRKDYKNLALICQQHLVVKDSVYQMALADELADKEARYETEKKEKEIARQKLIIQHEQDTRKIILFSLSGVILLLGAGSVLFMQRSRLIQEKKQFRSILDAEQNERIRIARDLHDSIGQMLSVVKMNVSGIHYHADESNKMHTAKTLDIVDKTIQEVRHISHNLIPEELNFGIVNALEELCMKINEAGQIQVSIDVEAGIAACKFSKQFELSLYRIVQEILTNMLKHADASSIKVSMSTRGNVILLAISDDGKGFDTTFIKESKGLGWKNIAARVKLLNGKMNIQSERIRGTQIEITIPK